MHVQRMAFSDCEVRQHISRLEPLKSQNGFA
jgi:hypothetical protein